MGCVSSKPDINDQHPNIFQVSNVNDQGDLVSPGQLEVTETELVLYQRGKHPTIWPLRSLRKYGFDSEIFSFECGRRCPTGQGIYAFRCRKAEQLFNIVQHNIVRNSSEESNPMGMNVITPNTTDFPLPTVSTGPPVQRRIPSQPEGYLNPVSAPNNIRSHPSLSRPGSITSNGPVSPTATSPPPVNATEISQEHNNNKRGSLILDHPYTNSSALAEIDSATQSNYANLGIVTSPTSTVPAEAYVSVMESPCHLYMNVDTNATKDVNETEEDARHCYANIDTKELEHLRPLLKSSIDTPLPSVPQTPTALYVTVREVNYAELDLDPSKNDAPTTSQITPDSPNRAKKSYATIDFQKTNALSQSINPPMEVEEGSRKTRHNSTISDVTARHSNSLSD
ncbi:IRS domain containing protein [Asbolus verrucosus]|uniref:IRS domain containing protein n=1 Tax=Asbolus verrucosus TaxID=1661398 RepID=A0A482W9L0_ASBVE|nr:IRS domain containing protein [Asbolus verrucosus]